MSTRLPGPPSADRLSVIGIRDDEYRTLGDETVGWRVHRTAGEHVLAWNAFREHGPHLRFDPRPAPIGPHPGVGVWYAATTPFAALTSCGGGGCARRCWSSPTARPG